MPAHSSPHASPHALRRRRIAGLGWRPDLPDPRDHLFSTPLGTLRTLPATVDLRPGCPPVYDQGEIGSCTANAIAGAIQFARRQAGKVPDFVPSRLFLYYNERSIEGSVSDDAGAQLRDGIKVANTLGVCPEPEWPYVATPAATDGGAFPAGSPPATRPPDAAYADALAHRVTGYQRLAQTLAQLKGCLASGMPFVFGFTVFDSLYDDAGAPRADIPLPTTRDHVLGGHAACAVGYDDAQRHFVIRNSWGAAVGDGGHFTMPYAYLTDHQLASDFWVVKIVEG